MNSDAMRGQSFPLGAALTGGGANFSLFSRCASEVQLLLFDQAEDGRASRIVRLDPGLHRSYHYWHVFLPRVKPGQLYGYRVHGPSDPARGLRCDPDKLLLDPYGRAVVVPTSYSREAHLRGFTRHPSSGVPEEMRGTYAGLIEKIPYLKQLGVTAVELLPVFQFDAQDCPPGKVNYWGYAPVSFFAPHQAYSSRHDPLGPLDEFRDLVKALHRAGLEIILAGLHLRGRHDDGRPVRDHRRCRRLLQEPSSVLQSRCYPG